MAKREMRKKKEEKRSNTQPGKSSPQREAETSIHCRPLLSDHIVDLFSKIIMSKCLVEEHHEVGKGFIISFPRPPQKEVTTTPRRSK